MTRLDCSKREWMEKLSNRMWVTEMRCAGNMQVRQSLNTLWSRLTSIFRQFRGELE